MQVPSSRPPYCTSFLLKQSIFLTPGPRWPVISKAVLVLAPGLCVCSCDWKLLGIMTEVGQRCVCACTCVRVHVCVPVRTGFPVDATFGFSVFFKKLVVLILKVLIF